MANKKMIYLDDESEILWNDLFHKSERTASSWIKQKLQEEKSGALDPFLLMKRLEEIKYQRQALEAEEKLTSQRLDMMKADGQKKGEDRVAYILDPRKLIVMTNTIKSLWHVEEKKAHKLAEEYLEINEKIRPELIEFIKTKLAEIQNG